MKERHICLNGLKPIKGLKSKQFFTFDIETMDGLKREKMFCWALAYKTRGKYAKITTIHGFRDFKPLFEFLSEQNKHLKKHEYRTIYVHNLDFEIGMLANYCVKHKIQFNRLNSGSKTLTLDIYDYKTKFVDSYQFLFTSQEKAEIEYNVDKSFRKINCNDLFEKPYSEWSSKDKKRVLEHNKNDVMALYEIMSKFQRFVFEESQLDSTNYISLAQLALACYRRTITEPIPNPFIYLHYDKHKKRKTYGYSKSEYTFVHASYFGGRTEVFDSRIHKNAKYIDRVSHYPSEMKFNKYPFGIPYWVLNMKEQLSLLEESCEKEGFMKCIVKGNESEQYPPLPKRRDHKIIFDNCEKEGIWALPELRYAHKRGYEIIPIKSLVFDESKDIFSSFVDKFFKIKSTAKGGKRQMSKIVLNSVYGKFGQAIERRELKYDMFYDFYEALDFANSFPEPLKVQEIDNGKAFVVAYPVESTQMKSFMNVCISSYITSYARINLLQKLHELEEKGINVLYCDTDSFTIEDSNLDEIEMSSELGGWDIEQSFDEVKFYAPKCYCSIKDGKPFLKMKGVDRMAIKRITESSKTLKEVEEKIRKPIQMAERFMSYTESLRHGQTLSTKKRSKHYSFVNNKRLFTDGKSIPFTDLTIPKNLVESN